MATWDVIQIHGGSAPLTLAKPSLLRVIRSLFAILIGIATCVLNFLPARAGPGISAATIARPGDARSGSLLLKTAGEGYVDARRLGIDVDLTVSGPTIRARVTQIFQNPTQDWVEAIYVYPLPQGAAVDTLKMVIGERVVIGEIKERQQARVVYEQAKQAGQKAALTEQERPNIFTNSVANIGPGESVLVQIEYQEPVHQSGDVFSLRVPMVVGPRYNPAPVVQTVDFRENGGGWGVATNDPVPDRDRISPPLLDPAENPPINPTAVTVRLQAGFPLGEVKSHFHAVKIDSPDNSTRVIKLAEGPVPADRDFELDLEAGRRKDPVGRPLPRTCGQRRLSAGLCHAARDRRCRAETAAARSHLRDRQFRVDGRHLDRSGQGQSVVRAFPPEAERSFQRDPFRSHHEHALSGFRPGR